ncbi:translocation/assembly module TamB domain-containing protein [Defluviimonas sp. SAOS-178_SWC]|uniref:translocation/assembly module TamB domain-containing protein n=1 Tax=Defluviimonas sp. SAOS-178_SWC TaxID=3121287 RepID=UPI0032219E93
MPRFLLSLLIGLLTFAAQAQDTAETTERDRDFLTAFLEDNLSALGRTVRIDGFAGALSSRATFDQLTIADADGVWLTIRDGAIGWNRTALLSGRVEISEMTAAEIELPRRPSAGKPAAEASGFSLPELPVAVQIGSIHANRVVLGEALFGAAAEVTLDGTMQLERGEGSADLSVSRIDGRDGRVSLTGSYANATRKATLDLLVAEEADGIAANLIGLPGTPSIELAVHGAGVIDDFRTDIALTTDGAPRMKGTVTLLATATDGAAPERSFSAVLGGDIAPLLLPEYQDFFGTDVTLEADGRRAPTGQLDLTRLVLGSRGVDVTGRLSLAPGGLPLQAALTTRIGLAAGGDVLLPIPGEKTYLRSAELTFRYDQARGDGWKLAGTMRGLRRAEISIGAVTLDGSGRIGRPGEGGVDAARVGGTITFAANGLEPTDANLADALGPELSGRAVFHWQQGAPLRVPVFDVTGQGYGAKGGLTLAGLEDGAVLSGQVEADVADMGRFSGLAGRPLGGSAALAVSGSGGILSGLFDVEATVKGRDLTVDQPELDRLLRDETSIVTSVHRDTEGIEIRQLDLVAATLGMSATGRLRTGASDLTATLDFGDLSVLGDRYRGAMTGEARLYEDGRVRHITLSADAAGLGVGQAEADRLLAGASELRITAEERDGRIRLDTFRLSNPQLTLTAEGLIEDEVRRIDLSARLADMALLAPGFPGPLTAEGRVTETAEGYTVDLSGEGPGATSARVSGTLAPDFGSADLSIAGGAQSAIINPFIAPRNVEGPVSFDLRLNGPLRLASLSGRVGLDNARLVAPTFGFELEAMGLAADLSDGRATLSGGANVRGGGRIDISGPVTLSAPFDGDLSIGMNEVRLRDPDLYDTTVSGAVSVRGPFVGGALISGAVALGRAEVRVPSTGLGGNAALTDIRHVSEPAAVHQTRVRAGLAQADGAARDRGPAYGLDLAISAPERIFVRGRGLDAEMGGALRLTGTTADIVPSGRFSLIRGRLDILGKRFTIDEGLIELQGALTPYIHFSAATNTDGITATIVIEGEALAPEIRFLSSPELPEEEVIAHLLFGRSLTSLSPFQAAQLASAVATLAGKGGEGIVSKLRKGFGLDDFDVTTDEDGGAGLRAGKYLSEKVYTDVTIGSDGKSEINLNLDIRPGVKARGTLGSDGDTGIGIYYERDY